MSMLRLQFLKIYSRSKKKLSELNVKPITYCFIQICTKMCNGYKTVITCSPCTEQRIKASSLAKGPPSHC